MRCERCVDEEREGEEMITFVSNWEGNLIVLRSFSSLSEKRLSWSADVPLKKPEEMVKKEREREREKGGLASVGHESKVEGGKGKMRSEVNKHRKRPKSRFLSPSPSRLNWLQYNSDTSDPSKCTLTTLSSSSGPSLHAPYHFTVRSPSGLPVFSIRRHPKFYPPRGAQSYLHSPHLCLCRLLCLLSLYQLKVTPHLGTCTRIVRQAETQRSTATQAQVIGRLA